MINLSLSVYHIFRRRYNRNIDFRYCVLSVFFHQCQPNWEVVDSHKHPIYNKHKANLTGGITSILDNAVIKNADELEFAVFCIENIAIRLGKNAEDIYQALTEESSILEDYIIPEYDILHTQGKDYIVDDIISLMKERGIQL